jgi:hypothetical protein
MKFSGKIFSERLQISIVARAREVWGKALLREARNGEFSGAAASISSVFD